MPTGDMIGNPDAPAPDVDRALEAIARRTSPDRNLKIDAGALAEALFSDSMPSNAIIIGAAWQLGLVPVSVEAIEEAFRLNAVAVETNIAAFHWGRAAVARPEAVARVLGHGNHAAAPSADARRLLAQLVPGAGAALERTLLIRVDELLAYQGPRLARSYLSSVAQVVDAERRLDAPAQELSESVARHLHKLLAYKDEYEVARLHLDPAERERLRAEFGDDAKFHVQLHPPLLRAMGLKRKLSFGPWFDPGLRALRAMRRVRGTPLDLFGYAHVRRVERALPQEYLALVDRALPYAFGNYGRVLEICELPTLIRGYEQVKLNGVERFREQAQTLLGELEAHGRLAA
jgi:indolepyruvate ferredoxin oxidoreductase